MRRRASTKAPARCRTWAALTLACALGGCSSTSQSSAVGRHRLGAGSEGGGDASLDVSSAFCGDDVLQLRSHSPNVYFLIDASGSMAAPYLDQTRFEAVRYAAASLIQTFGSYLRVGAAVFPLRASATLPCAVGDEVLPVLTGEGSAWSGLELARAFLLTTAVLPGGGTPTAATLRHLRPRLEALSGETVLILATDGGPNCNVDAACGTDDCMPNLERECLPEQNCCVSTPESPNAQLLCLDRQPSIDAVAALNDAGVLTYVVGIPGSEPYAELLGQLAKAGGTEQREGPGYYAVTQLEALETTLGAIVGRELSCSFDLDAAPEDPDKTNVYLDGVVLPAASDDGWRWTGPSSLELLGEACARLKAGRVTEVRVLSGCPTEQPR